MRVFSNSSPLMYLAKIGRIELLMALFKEIIIPKKVYDEIIGREKEERFIDAIKVERAVKEGWIKSREVLYKREFGSFGEIDEGESALIYLAKKEKADLVLIDDASARIVAESFGLNVKGTLYVLLLAFRKKILSKKEIKELIKELIEAGFRVSAKIYFDVLSEIEKS